MARSLESPKGAIYVETTKVKRFCILIAKAPGDNYETCISYSFLKSGSSGLSTRMKVQDVHKFCC